MTVAEYRKSLERLPHKTADGRTIAEVMSETINIWSNDAARGYVMMAGEIAGVDPETVRSIVSAMRIAFSEMSTDEAEAFYMNSIT